MRMSSTEEYGLRCLLQVARHQASGPVPIQLIASHEGLSPEHTAKLLRILREAELVSSTRGSGGGYQLARDAKDISVLQVLEAIDGSLLPEDWCGRHAGRLDNCVHSTGCSLVGLWLHIARVMGGALSTISLDDLATGRLNATTRRALEANAS